MREATRRLTREEFEEVVDLLSVGIQTGRGRRMAYLGYQMSVTP
jgi:hypothetical protein